MLNMLKSRTFWVAFISIVLNILVEIDPLITPELFGEGFAVQFHTWSAFGTALLMIFMRQITVGPPGVDRGKAVKALSENPDVDYPT